MFTALGHQAGALLEEEGARVEGRSVEREARVGAGWPYRKAGLDPGGLVGHAKQLGCGELLGSQDGF